MSTSSPVSTISWQAPLETTFGRESAIDFSFFRPWIFSRRPSGGCISSTSASFSATASRLGAPNAMAMRRSVPNWLMSSGCSEPFGFSKSSAGPPPAFTRRSTISVISRYGSTSAVIRCSSPSRSSSAIHSRRSRSGATARVSLWRRALARPPRRGTAPCPARTHRRSAHVARAQPAIVRVVSKRLLTQRPTSSRQTAVVLERRSAAPTSSRRVARRPSMSQSRACESRARPRVIGESATRARHESSVILREPLVASSDVGAIQQRHRLRRLERRSSSCAESLEHRQRLLESASRVRKSHLLASATTPRLV